MWGVHHRKSPVEYHQSNGRAELGIKTGKRIIMNNASPDSSLNNDKAAAALMQYHNTPLPHLNLSPAQLMLHCVLRHPIPTNPKYYELHQGWLISASDHEKALSKRNEEILQKYNSSSKTLPEIPVETHVMIHQPQKKGVPRWSKTGKVASKLPNRQYTITCHATGKVTLHNRKFTKPLTSSPIKAHPIISPSIIQNNTITPSNNVTESHSTNQLQPQIIALLPAPTPSNHSPNIPGQSITLPLEITLALKRLTKD